jgi:hypothetical protein
MSGTLRNLITGQGGVNIGGVQLYDFEIPDVIRWGTKQVTKEFTYPGGQNLIQAMGPTREPISWSGQFFSGLGSDATDRARLLDGICSAGALVPVSWGDMHFDVLVTRFVADYKHQWQGHYSIEMLVQWDYQQPVMVTSAAGDAANDLETALSIANNIQGVATALLSVQTAQTSTPAPGALIATQATIQAGIAAVGASAAASGTVLIGTVAGPLTIGALASAAGNTAATCTAFGYAARAAANWSLVAGISTPNVVPNAVQPDLSQYPGA